MRKVDTDLNEVLAFGLRDQRLQLRRGERVDETGLGDDQEEDLGAGQDGEFVGLDTCQCVFGRGMDAFSCRRRGRRLAFFMIPALRLEKVM